MQFFIHCNFFGQEYKFTLLTCSGTLLDVEDVTSSHIFGNYNYIFQKRATLFNRSTYNVLTYMLCCLKSRFLINLVTS